MIELTKETPDIETASDAYAQRFTGEAGRYLLSEQEAAVRAVLADWRGETVLDVGGGHGQLTPFLLPMLVHRRANGAAALRGVERAAKLLGLTQTFGSPVVMRADRRES